ncbi:unnamed protein product [Bursaphelenchus xylophilus]|uniref:(pine wood nematode) hypothetical protein n=1 Tax=Bursaphelenchus xylophilus TaxID=6326 RepID=A0A1I7SF91_BURXY|nr:unnamed protein product [Bursaphelenchus xylophilus]CAG9130461.1 unnamed protein product [Bursaphelenchus xylophilus]
MGPIFRFHVQMPLAKKGEQIIKATGFKMSKKKAVHFKKRLNNKKPNVGIGMVEEYAEQMEIDIHKSSTTRPKTDKTTKKRVLRQSKKEEMRAFLKKKIQKTKAKNPDNMDVELEQPNAEAEKAKPKVNAKRIKKADLPIVVNAKDKRRAKGNQKELKETGVVSARRISKKKAKKILQARNRDIREKERRENGMEN